MYVLFLGWAGKGRTGDRSDRKLHVLSVKLTTRAVARATSRGDLYCPEGRCGRKENAVSVFPTHIAALGQYDAGGTAPIPGTNIFLLSMKVVLGFCDILCFCY
jgi:hypothetical protein